MCRSRLFVILFIRKINIIGLAYNLTAVAGTFVTLRVVRDCLCNLQTFGELLEML